MMIIHNIEQGTEEWRLLRSGIPTASEFDKIITPKTLKPSKSARGLMCRLVAESILGRPLEDGTSAFMQRGIDEEPAAVSWYEFQNDVDIERVGFVTNDEECVGCSPDGFVGADGVVEIKVPGAAKHIEYMDGDADSQFYRCQAQGTLWLTGRKWCDFVSYNPELPPVVIRFERDEEFIAALETAVMAFGAEMIALRDRILAKCDSEKGAENAAA